MEYSIRFTPKSMVTEVAAKSPREGVPVPNPREGGQTWGGTGSIDFYCEQRLPGTDGS